MNATDVARSGQKTGYEFGLFTTIARTTVEGSPRESRGTVAFKGLTVKASSGLGSALLTDPFLLSGSHGRSISWSWWRYVAPGTAPSRRPNILPSGSLN